MSAACVEKLVYDFNCYISTVPWTTHLIKHSFLMLDWTEFVHNVFSKLSLIRCSNMFVLLGDSCNFSALRANNIIPLLYYMSFYIFWCLAHQFTLRCFPGNQTKIHCVEIWDSRTCLHAHHYIQL